MFEFLNLKVSVLNVCLRQKKKCRVSGNPIDPTFLGPTLKHFGTSENFSSIFRVFVMIFMLFLCKNLFPKKKKFAFLPILKNIEMFLETRHFFFFFPYHFSVAERNFVVIWIKLRHSVLKQDTLAGKNISHQIGCVFNLRYSSSNQRPHRLVVVILQQKILLPRIKLCHSVLKQDTLPGKNFSHQVGCVFNLRYSSSNQRPHRLVEVILQQKILLLRIKPRH